MTIIRCIVGLGNPGDKYHATRHNAGFWLVDRLADQARETFRSESRFSGDLCRVVLGRRQVWLFKPMTYMNCSGRAVSGLCRYHKIEPAELLVAHDEIDLAPGTVRLKTGGGHGGHNGLRDIVKALASADFNRMRIGVGHPGDSRAVVDYVLKAPGREEASLIGDALQSALDVMPSIVEGEFEPAMNRLHARR